MCEICDQSKRLIENDPFKDEPLKKSLVENLKGAKQSNEAVIRATRRRFVV